MAIQDMLNQTITLYTRSSYDKYGKLVVGSGTNYKARFQEQTKDVLGANGDVIHIVGTVYVAPSVTIAVNDKVTYNGNDYKVFQRYSAVDGTGTSNHIKLELIKWQE